MSRIKLEWMRKYIGFFCIILLAIYPGTSLAESTNIVINPGFDSGITPWLFYTNGVGTLRIISSDLEGNNYAKLAFGRGGTNIQLYQDGITLEPNTSYRLNFVAYSNTGHDMLVNLMGIPYISYGLAYKADLSTNWQTFTTEFTTKSFSNRVSNGRLQFWFADFASKGDTYYIDDIRLEQVSPPELPIIITNPVIESSENWAYPDMPFRIPVTINAGSFERNEKPVEMSMNFTRIIQELGKTGTFDENSIRVVEIDSIGLVLSSKVPFQFDKDTDFNTNSKASGTIVFIMDGNTQTNATRYYNVYFGLTGVSYSPMVVTPQMTIIDTSDEGVSSYQIEANGSTYYFHKKVGGFSSLVDSSGNDWISYNTADTGAFYRGIPNAIYPEGYFHPGVSACCTTSIVSQGPLKIRIRSVTKDGLWESLWDFYPHYATMTLVKAGHDYWFIYEGTPGGVLEPDKDFMVRPDGTQTLLSQSWYGDLPNNEWVYFSDPTAGRSLFAVHHEDDTLQDEYWPYPEYGLTVFGFGRNDMPSPTPLLSSVPQHFTIGLMDGTGFTQNSQTIYSAYKDLTITNGPTQEINTTQLPGQEINTTQLPGIVTQPSDQIVEDGQTATFSVVATGSEPLTYKWQYQWQNNYVDLPDATNSSFTTPAATLSNTGAVVRVIVSNSLGSVTSNTATLTVTASSPLPGITTQLSLHPDNNHYFVYKGKPTVLIGSNEHYGAVLNLDFDYDLYLNELQSKGLNYVRIFSGTYIEPDPNMGSWWDIDDNTLAPTNNGFISPWARSTTEGFAGDSNSYKFDLSKWNTEYFNRLRDFVGKADSKGIVVEYVFFTPFWSKDDLITPLPNMWARSPMNIINNINNVGDTASWDNDGFDMVWDVRAGNHNGGLTPYMGDMVTKVVQELNEFDNVIYQSSIEPFKGDGNGGNEAAITMETIFDDYINSKIVAADTPKKHLISQSRGDESSNVNIKPEVSILSWDSNGEIGDFLLPFYSLNKALSNDEVTYLGRGDVQYRRLGWKWIMSGAAIFNMLDLSFTPYRGEEAGTKIMPYSTSHDGKLLLGGSEALRNQLGILNSFIHSFDFVKMKPDNSILTGGAPAGTRALVEIGKQYAIYLPAGTSANPGIDLPAGNYRADWVNTKTGNIDRTEDIVGHTGGNKVLLSPEYSEDIALRILSR